MPAMDGWRAPDFIWTQRTPTNAKQNKCKSWKIPHTVWRRKGNVMKIGRNKHNPKFTLGDMNLKYTDKYQYLWLCAKQQKQPRRPHQSNKSKSRECLPNATGHSREQELQQHRNANHMAANTELHNIDNSLQHWNLESGKNWKRKS